MIQVLFVLLAAVLGVIVGIKTNVEIPVTYSRYTAVMLLAALDSIFGALKASLNGRYENAVFLSGLITNSAVAGALTFLAYSVTGPVVALVPTTGRLVPLGFATLLIGFFAMAVRRKAVSQIVGLLIVNNGIALVAFLATSGFPLVVELGASLDVLLVVVLLRVMASQMGSKFGVLDLDQLRELHD